MGGTRRSGEGVGPAGGIPFGFTLVELLVVVAVVTYVDDHDGKLVGFVPG